MNGLDLLGAEVVGAPAFRGAAAGPSRQSARAPMATHSAAPAPDPAPVAPGGFMPLRDPVMAQAAKSSQPPWFASPSSPGPTGMPQGFMPLREAGRTTAFQAAKATAYTAAAAAAAAVAAATPATAPASSDGGGSGGGASDDGSSGQDDGSGGDDSGYGGGDASYAAAPDDGGDDGSSYDASSDDGSSQDDGSGDDSSDGSSDVGFDFVGLIGRGGGGGHGGGGHGSGGRRGGWGWGGGWGYGGPWWDGGGLEVFDAQPSDEDLDDITDEVMQRIHARTSVGMYDINSAQKQMNTLKQCTVGIARTLIAHAQQIASATIATAKDASLPGITSLKKTQGHLQWHADALAKLSDPNAIYESGPDAKLWAMQAFIDSNAVSEGSDRQNQIWDAMWSEISSQISTLPATIVKTVVDTTAHAFGMPAWVLWTGGSIAVVLVLVGVWKLLKIALPVATKAVVNRYLP